MLNAVEFQEPHVLVATADSEGLFKSPKGGQMRATKNGYMQTVYFPAKIAAEIEREARRIDRSVPWLVRISWEIARERIMTIPDPPSNSGGE